MDMSPVGTIARLDAAIARRGVTVRLARVGAGAAEADCRAFVRRYEPSELIGSIQQGDREVVLSPTALALIAWTIPAPGDRIRVDGRWHRIMAEPEQFVMDDVLVRLLLHIRGM